VLILAGLFTTAPAFCQAANSGNQILYTLKNQGYPQYLSFRGEYNKPAHASYEAFSAFIDNTAGWLRKYLPEELMEMNSDSIAWSRRYAKENPGKLMLLHFNNEARQASSYGGLREQYFPGHWVHLPGTFLKEAISPTRSTLKLENARPFKLSAYRSNENPTQPLVFPQHILLVPLTESGERLWYESEHVVLQKVDYLTSTIEVERGAFGSSPRSFDKGAYVAPLAGDVWGKQVMWFYNFSSLCPKDRQGKNAGDVLSNELAGLFSKAGPLSHLHGIAFDVDYWKPRDDTWDTNNDGIADQNDATLSRAWRDGNFQFQKQLRLSVGNTLLMTADGQHAYNQQALGTLNGIESEGLVQHNDGYRGFSRMVNTHDYWRLHNDFTPDFRYVVLKLMQEADAKMPEQLRRFAIGSASCLEAFVTSFPPMGMPAGLDTPGVFGKPTSQLLRPAAQTPDLLSTGALKGSGDLEQLLSRISLTGGKAEIAIDNLLLIPSASQMTLRIANLTLPQTDITIFVELMSLDALPGFDQQSAVPHIVNFALTPYPVPGDQKEQELHTTLYGMFGTQKYTQSSAYFRFHSAVTGPRTLTLTFPEAGRVQIKSLHIHAATDLLIRHFEKATVIVNPSLTAQSYHLPESEKTVNVPALDAMFIPKPGKRD